MNSISVTTEELKIWIVIRQDLNMPMGKMAVQVGHCIQLLVNELIEQQDNLYTDYISTQSIVKVAVSVQSEKELLDVVESCKLDNIPVRLVKDAGRTVFNEPTYTVCAFGPVLRSLLPPKLKRLQLYKDKEDEKKV